MKPRITRLTVAHDKFDNTFEVCLDKDMQFNEFVRVYCSDSHGECIEIQPDEWPFLRDAIDRMFVEIAEAQVEPESKAPQGAEDGWIPWEGGDCPVGGNCDVTVRFRDESDAPPCPARFYEWCHDGAYDDIIAYKVVG